MFYDKGFYQLQAMDMLEFMAFMCLGGLVPMIISTYILEVKHHLWLQGARDFNDSFLLKLTLQGVVASPHEPDMRLPITFLVLDGMLHALPLVHDNQFEVCIYFMLLTVSFHGLFHPGELAMSEHVILAENVHIGTNKAVIILPTSKANCTCMAQHITINSYSTACPIKALTAYTLIYPNRPGEFFIWLSGNPVLTQDIACILNKLSTFLNLPQQLIKSHSLHIGGSTHLYLSCHSLKHIQVKGRGSSQAFQRYIRCSKESHMVCQ